MERVKEIDINVISILKRGIAEFFLDHNKEPKQIVVGSDVFELIEKEEKFCDELEYEIKSSGFLGREEKYYKYDGIEIIHELFLEDTLIQFIG